MGKAGTNAGIVVDKNGEDSEAWIVAFTELPAKLDARCNRGDLGNELVFENILKLNLLYA